MSSNILITNKEAAEELKGILDFYKIVPRGSSKSHVPRLIKIMALQKAIEVLEKTPDE